MQRHLTVVVVALAAMFGLSSLPTNAQGLRFITPPDQVVAIRAGRLFEPKSGNLLANQIVLIKGERITDVGPNLAIPAGARVIDLSQATVMPGMTDAHAHVNTDRTPVSTAANRAIVALANAQIDLGAGFTTIADMDTRGGFNTVDLRDQINAGRVMGPRMQVVGQSLNQRASEAYPDLGARFYSDYTEGKHVNSPWEGRAAVREAKLHGVDMVKIYTTQDFVGPIQKWYPDGSQVNSPSLTFEEVAAIVDEAHRLGLKVACHAYGGEGMQSCLKAGVDLPNHLLGLDAEGVKVMVEKKLPYVVTVDDLISTEKLDLQITGGKNSRIRLLEQAFKKALAAGIPIVFGSGATSDVIPHGKQANQFSYYTRWGMTPVQALQTTFINAPRYLNYHWETQIGTIEKGKFADIIAVSGSPLADITEMERVKFVMKGGLVVRDDLASPATGAR